MGIVETINWLVQPSQLPNLAVVLLNIMFFISFITAIVFSMLFVRATFGDNLVEFDKNMRPRLYKIKNLARKESVTIGSKKSKRTYQIDTRFNYPSPSGKIWTFRTFNKPEGLEIKPNNASWVTSESMHSWQENENLQKIATPSRGKKDILIIIAIAMSAFCVILCMIILGKLGKLTG